MSARNCKRLLHECLKELRLPTMRTGFLSRRAPSR